MDLFAHVTLKFEGWPRKTIRHLFYTYYIVHHFKAIEGAIWPSLSPCTVINPILLIIYSKPLLNSNWSYSPETLNSGKNRWFFSRMTLQFDVWPWKTIGHLFYATSSFVHHFVAIAELKLELQSGNAQFGSNSTIFLAVWPWDLTDDLETQ